MALSDVERAAILVERGVKLQTACDRLELNRSTIQRALKARKDGRQVGVKGRPFLLSTEEESQLESWITARNNLGDPAPHDAICEQVR